MKRQASGRKYLRNIYLTQDWYSEYIKRILQLKKTIQFKSGERGYSQQVLIQYPSGTVCRSLF